MKNLLVGSGREKRLCHIGEINNQIFVKLPLKGTRQIMSRVRDEKKPHPNPLKIQPSHEFPAAEQPFQVAALGACGERCFLPGSPARAARSNAGTF